MADWMDIWLDVNRSFPVRKKRPFKFMGWCGSQIGNYEFQKLYLDI